MDKKSPKVQQIGTTLVAAFDNAHPPLIWKFDLERNHSFAVALQGKDDHWDLGVTSGRDEFHPVARFRSHADAEEAFLKTQKALLTTKHNRWRTAAITLGVLMVLMIIFVVMPMATVVHGAIQKGSLVKPPAAASSSELKDGVPLDADKVLQPPP